VIRNAANIFGLYFDHGIHGYLRHSVIIIDLIPNTNGGVRAKKKVLRLNVKLMGLNGPVEHNILCLS